MASGCSWKLGPRIHTWIYTTSCIQSLTLSKMSVASIESTKQIIQVFAFWEKSEQKCNAMDSSNCKVRFGLQFVFLSAYQLFVLSHPLKYLRTPEPNSFYEWILRNFHESLNLVISSSKFSLGLGFLKVLYMDFNDAVWMGYRQQSYINAVISLLTEDVTTGPYPQS